MINVGVSICSFFYLDCSPLFRFFIQAQFSKIKYTTLLSMRTDAMNNDDVVFKTQNKKPKTHYAPLCVLCTFYPLNRSNKLKW